MSLAEGRNEQVFSILSNKYQFIESKKLGTRCGNSSVNWVEYTPTSGVTGNNAALAAGNTVRWDIQPGSIFTDSAPYVQVDLYVTINMAADSTGVLTNRNSIGTKAFPVNRCISSSVATFNNMAEISSNPAQLVDSLSLMESQEMLNTLTRSYKQSPLMAYDNAQLTDVLRSFADSYSGSSNNYLNWEFVQPLTGSGAAGNPITFAIRLKEKLLSRPFQWHTKDPQPFLGVSKLNIDLTFSSEMAHVIQCQLGANAAAAGITQCEFRNPRLIMLGETPSLKVPIPRVCYYNTIKHVDYRTPALAAGAATTVTTSSVQHNVVPKAFCIYAKYTQDIALGAALNGNRRTNPDRFLAIKNLSMTFGNRQNLLRNFTEENLYSLSVKNGYNLRYSHFVNQLLGANRANGGLVVVLPSDAGTDSYQSNMMANFVTEWRVVVDASSLANNTPFDIHIVELFDNTLEYNDGLYTERAASISPDQVERSAVIYENVVYPDQQIMGGSFWSSLKSIGKKAWDVVRHPAFKAAVKVARNLDPVKKYTGDQTDAGKVLSNLGYGKKKKPATRKGRGVVTSGGRALSKRELMGMLAD